MELDWNWVGMEEREVASWKLRVSVHVSQDGSWMAEVVWSRSGNVTGLNANSAQRERGRRVRLPSALLTNRGQLEAGASFLAGKVRFRTFWI